MRGRASGEQDQAWSWLDLGLRRVSARISSSCGVILGEKGASGPCVAGDDGCSRAFQCPVHWQCRQICGTPVPQCRPVSPDLWHSSAQCRPCGPTCSASRQCQLHCVHPGSLRPPKALPMRPHGWGGSAGHRPRWAWSAVRRSRPLRRLWERAERASGTFWRRVCTAVTRADLPLRARLEFDRAIAQAVGRRCRPMSSELWQQELERWLLARLSAITLKSTRHRQGE